MRRLLLVGAGFAGVTVARRLREASVAFDWVEAEHRVGGALHRVHNPLYGWEGGATETGAELARSLEQESAVGGLRLGLRVERVARAADGFGVTWCAATGGEPEGPWQRVVLCTGTAPRRWEVPGSESRWGRGVELSTHARGAAYAGRAVAVVGGGDAAAEGALRLASMGCPVWLVVRGPRLTAQTRFAAAVLEHPAIEISFGCAVTAVESVEDEAHLRAIHLSDGRRICVAGLFVRVGVAPTLPELQPMPLVDAFGYLRVDASGETSVAGLYAVGEVSGRETSQLAAVAEQAERVAAALVMNRSRA